MRYRIGALYRYKDDDDDGEMKTIRVVSLTPNKNALFTEPLSNNVPDIINAFVNEKDHLPTNKRFHNVYRPCEFTSFEVALESVKYLASLHIHDGRWTSLIYDEDYNIIYTTAIEA